MKHEEAQIAAIREVIHDGREDFATGAFDTIDGREDRATLVKEITGRSPYWLKPGRPARA
jgi:hypothetical protein